MEPESTWSKLIPTPRISGWGGAGAVGICQLLTSGCQRPHLMPVHWLISTYLHDCAIHGRRGTSKRAIDARGVCSDGAQAVSDVYRSNTMGRKTAYRMGTRVWLHGLVDDQANLDGQRAIVLPGRHKHAVFSRDRRRETGAGHATKRFTHSKQVRASQQGEYPCQRLHNHTRRWPRMP